jgi:hypothetical protein
MICEHDDVILNIEWITLPSGETGVKRITCSECGEEMPIPSSWLPGSKEMTEWDG